MERMLEATARAEERHFWFRALRRNARRWLEDALDGRRGLTIVDCGTGTGRNLDWLSAFGRAVGIERSPAGLREARRHRRPVVQATVARLPLADGIADVATSFDVLYCLDDDTERAAIREMRRVLKPGGIAVMNVAALDILHGSHSTLTGEIRRYTKRRLAERLETAGFSVLRMSYTNLATFPLTLAVRSLDRFRGRASEASEADLTTPAGPINASLDFALRVEGWALRVVNLPVGSSILCLARRT